MRKYIVRIEIDKTVRIYPVHCMCRKNDADVKNSFQEKSGFTGFS